MSSLHNSLAQLSTGYSIFEKDQVLTEAQLNSVSDYLDDQDRLSRVQLIGAGIVCGLKVDSSGAQIRVSAGTGITSDGDLVRFAADRTFDRFKAYDTSAPVYPPLYVAATMLPAYELVETGANDPLAQGLNQFGTVSGASLTSMSAMLLVESYIKDSDLCSGTDCDNLGRDYVSQTRILLVPNSSLASLLPNIPSPRSAASALPHIVMRRAIVTSTLNTPAAINSRFINAARAMVADLSSAFAALWPNAGFLFEEVFSSDPTGGWTTRLNNLNNAIDANTSGAQYFYDFLKDVVATWNQMRALMADELPYGSAMPQDFPKHLLLGDLNDPDAHHFAFYPAAAAVDSRPRRHLQFLAKKIETLITYFSLPSASAVRVSPSSSSDTCDARAIPIYYAVDAKREIANFWNFDLSSRGMAVYNYGYHAASYGALGAAADPLNSCIDGCDFFRIEGQIGSPVTSALAAIEREISDFNLPFAVTSVFLGGAPAGIVGKRGAGYSDLNRLHYLLRQDLYHSLDDISRFNDRFKAQVDQAVATGTVTDDVTGSDGTTVTELSNSKHLAISGKTSAVKTTMAMSYKDYRADSGWKSAIADTMINAGEYKFQLGKVVKTEFTTPFDNLFGGIKVDWLDWLDVLIDKKDEERDQRRLFREFIKLYPGLEHSGGVVRGGTFVLVYDSAGTVVADFMLSHYLIEEEVVVDEPVLPKPNIRPNWVIDNGIRLQPSLDKLFTTKLDLFKGDLDQEWGTKFDLQATYTTAFQNSIGMVTELYNKQAAVEKIQEPVFEDATLGLLAEKIARERAIANDYLAKSQDTSLTQRERDYYAQELDKTQQNLAKSAVEVARYMAVNDSNLSFGKDGYRAMQEINNSMALIRGNATANAHAKQELGDVQRDTGNTVLKQGLGTVIAIL